MATRNLKRVMRDYELLLKEGPQHGIWIKMANPDTLDLFYVMLIGPDGTPYEGALYFFTLEPWVDYNNTQNGLTYPANPPRVLHVSPWSIRSHPNLYHGGEYVAGHGAKVCLSILGTWMGPPWTPMYGFMQIFQTILSILDNEPLRNEPSFERGNCPEIGVYTTYVQFVVLRETLTKVILPTVDGTMKDPIIGRFVDEIREIWETRRGKYITQMNKLAAVHAGERVVGGMYGNVSYVGKLYTFDDILAKLKPPAADIQPKCPMPKK